GPGLPLVEDCQQHRPTVTLRNALMKHRKSVFTIDRNRCSRSTGWDVHDQTESVFTIHRNAQRYPGLKIHEPRIIRLFEVLLHGGPQIGGWTARQMHQAVLDTFNLSEK